MQALPLAMFLTVGVLLAPSVLAQDETVVLALDEGGATAAYRFDPWDVRVAPGAKLVLRAVGQEPHTLTPVETGAFEDVRVGIGGEASFRAPTEPGEYRFYCRFHATPASPPGTAMVGVLEVAAAVAPTGPPSAPSRGTPSPFWIVLVALGLASAVIARAPRRGGENS